MTNEEKRICAQRLFDEIGNIDDRFIYEASTPYTARSVARLVRTFAIGAVSIALALSIVAGVFVVGMMVGNKSAENEGYRDEMFDVEAGDVVDGTAERAGISQRMTSLRAQTSDALTPKEDIDLFDGTPKVIWKYTDETQYRTRNISDDEYSSLTTLLSKNMGERVESGAYGTLEGVWISSGDGLVISPCLEMTSGNVGYGEIFDYEPEYEPSTELTDSLCDYIS